MIKTGAQLVQDAKQTITEKTIEELQQEMNEHTVLIDVREPQEFSQGRIDGAVNFPRGVLEMQLANHPVCASSENPLETLNQQEIYLICRSGARSALAAESLNRMGFEKVTSVAGGMMAWEQKGLPLVK